MKPSPRRVTGSRCFPLAAADGKALEVAYAAVEAGRFGLFDALLLATAKEAGCTVALSEDKQDGSALDGIVVRNPLRGGVLPDDLRALVGMP